MSAAKIQAEARDLVAALPNQPPIVCVCIDAYGHRRLYPVTATADAIAALVGAKTLEQWHLNSADQNLALRYRVQTIDGLRSEIQAHHEWCKTMDAIEGARAMMAAATAEALAPVNPVAWSDAATRAEILNKGEAR